MVALRKSAIVVAVVALGYMIFALQARSAEFTNLPAVTADQVVAAVVAD